MKLTQGVILGIRVFACYTAFTGIQAVLGDYHGILKDDVQTTLEKADAALAGAEPADLRKIEERAAQRRGGSTLKRIMTQAGFITIGTGVLLFIVAPPLARVLCGQKKEDDDQEHST